MHRFLGRMVATFCILIGLCSLVATFAKSHALVDSDETSTAPVQLAQLRRLTIDQLLRLSPQDIARLARHMDRDVLQVYVGPLRQRCLALSGDPSARRIARERFHEISDPFIRAFWAVHLYEHGDHSRETLGLLRRAIAIYRYAAESRPVDAVSVMGPVLFHAVAPRRFEYPYAWHHYAASLPAVVSVTPEEWYSFWRQRLPSSFDHRYLLSPFARGTGIGTQAILHFFLLQASWRAPEQLLIDALRSARYKTARAWVALELTRRGLVRHLREDDIATARWLAQASDDETAFVWSLAQWYVSQQRECTIPSKLEQRELHRTLHNGDAPPPHEHMERVRRACEDAGGAQYLVRHLRCIADSRTLLVTVIGMLEAKRRVPARWLRRASWLVEAGHPASTVLLELPSRTAERFVRESARLPQIPREHPPLEELLAELALAGVVGGGQPRTFDSWRLREHLAAWAVYYAVLRRDQLAAMARLVDIEAELLAARIKARLAACTAIDPIARRELLLLGRRAAPDTPLLMAVALSARAAATYPRALPDFSGTGPPYSCPEPNVDAAPAHRPLALTAQLESATSPARYALLTLLAQQGLIAPRDLRPQARLFTSLLAVNRSDVRWCGAVTGLGTQAVLNTYKRWVRTVAARADARATVMQRYHTISHPRIQGWWTYELWLRGPRNPLVRERMLEAYHVIEELRRVAPHLSSRAALAAVLAYPTCGRRILYEALPSTPAVGPQLLFLSTQELERFDQEWDSPEIAPPSTSFARQLIMSALISYPGNPTSLYEKLRQTSAPDPEVKAFLAALCVLRGYPRPDLASELSTLMRNLTDRQWPTIDHYLGPLAWKLQYVQRVMSVQSPSAPSSLLERIGAWRKSRDGKRSDIQGFIDWARSHLRSDSAAFWQTVLIVGTRASPSSRSEATRRLWFEANHLFDLTDRSVADVARRLRCPKEWLEYELVAYIWGLVASGTPITDYLEHRLADVKHALTRAAIATALYEVQGSRRAAEELSALLSSNPGILEASGGHIPTGVLRYSTAITLARNRSQ